MEVVREWVPIIISLVVFVFVALYFLFRIVAMIFINTRDKEAVAFLETATLDARYQCKLAANEINKNPSDKNKQLNYGLAEELYLDRLNIFCMCIRFGGRAFEKKYKEALQELILDTIKHNKKLFEDRKRWRQIKILHERWNRCI